MYNAFISRSKNYSNRCNTRVDCELRMCWSQKICCIFIRSLYYIYKYAQSFALTFCRCRPLYSILLLHFVFLFAYSNHFYMQFITNYFLSKCMLVKQKAMYNKQILDEIYWKVVPWRLGTSDQSTTTLAHAYIMQPLCCHWPNIV